MSPLPCTAGAHAPQPIPDDGGQPTPPPGKPAKPRPIDPPDHSPPMELPPPKGLPIGR
ncbi:MAG: hypothetical protein ACN6O3_06665 [Comamonas sp.]